MNGFLKWFIYLVIIGDIIDGKRYDGREAVTKDDNSYEYEYPQI